MSATIGIQITTRCNLSCTHCFVDPSGEDIPVGLIEKIASSDGPARCPRLDFTGGEPTLHPRFAEILNILAERGRKFSLVSNGWNFADFYRMLSPHLNHLVRIDFSLDGATETVHDTMRRNGSFRRLLQAVSICRATGIPFGLRTVITKRNVRELEQVALLAARLGAEETAFVPILPTPRAAAGGLLLEPEDMKGIVPEVQRLRSVLRIRITLTTGCPDADPLLPCPTLARNALFVNAKGKLTFCCHLTGFVGADNDTEVIGDLHDISLGEARRRMAEGVAEFKKEKARRMSEGRFGPLDYFPCWYCLKYFRKVDWSAKFPDSPWGDDVIGRHRRGSRTMRFRRNPDVLASPLGDGTGALIHPDAKLPYVLNKTGMLIWGFIENAHTTDEIARRLRDKFDVAPETARRDAAAFIGETRLLSLVLAAE